MADYTIQNYLDLIEQFETEGRNVMNPRYKEDPKKYTAGGYWQILDSNWKKYGPMVGVDTKKYPTAITAPRADQQKVATHLLTNTDLGLKNWTNTNARLAKFLGMADDTKKPDDKKPSPVGTPLGPVTFTTAPKVSEEEKPKSVQELMQMIRDNPDLYPDLYKENFPEASPFENWLFNPEQHPYLGKSGVSHFLEGGTVSPGIREMIRGSLRLGGYEPTGAPQTKSPGYAGAADILQGGMKVGTPVAIGAAPFNLSSLPLAIAAGGVGGVLGEGAKDVSKAYGQDPDQQRFWQSLGETAGGVGTFEGGSKLGRMAKVGSLPTVANKVWSYPWVRGLTKATVAGMTGHPIVGGMALASELYKAGDIGRGGGGAGRLYKSFFGGKGPKEPVSKFMSPANWEDFIKNSAPEDRVPFRDEMINNLKSQGYKDPDASRMAENAFRKAATADAERAKKAADEQKAEAEKQQQQQQAAADRQQREAEKQQRAQEKAQKEAKEAAEKSSQGPNLQQLNVLKGMLRELNFPGGADGFRQMMSPHMSPDEITFHINDALGQKFGVGPTAQMRPTNVGAETIPGQQPPGPVHEPMGGWQQILGQGSQGGEPYTGPKVQPQFQPPQEIRIQPRSAEPEVLGEPKPTLVDKWVDALVAKGIDPTRINLKDSQVISRLRHDLDLGKTPKPDAEALADISNRTGIIQRHAEAHPGEPHLKSRQLEITPPVRGPGGKIVTPGDIKINPLGRVKFNPPF